MRRCVKIFFKALYLSVRTILLWPFLVFRKTLLPRPEQIHTILLLRHDRIGDMVISTSVFQALKERFPAAAIIVLASERNAALIQNDPAVGEIIIYKDIVAFRRECRKRRIDLAVDLFLTYELKQAFLLFLSGAKYRLGFEEAGREVFFNIKGPRISSCRSMRDQLHGLLVPLGVTAKYLEPRLIVSEAEKKEAAVYLASVGLRKEDLKIAMHPGGFYRTQRWSRERFVEVARRCVDRYDARIILFGDATDRELISGMQKEIGRGCAAAAALSLRQFAAVLAQCNLLLCNNSGPLHIAAALGVPTVSTLGPTDRNLWSPEGKNHIVLSGNLPCSPCSRIVCAVHTCMDSITVSQFLEAVETQLAGMGKA
ncbi:MAG: glycosyltransferase family 9 protein [Candidatus Omnitrophota bacterium]